jgi:hypothetical protein
MVGLLARQIRGVNASQVLIDQLIGGEEQHFKSA